MSTKRKAKVRFWQSKKGWRWRVRHSNSKILAAASEDFTRRSDALRNYERTLAALVEAEIED